MKQTVLSTLGLGFSLSLFTSAWAACPILFDGRVKNGTTPADFDKETSIYDDQYVHGQNQTWADIIKLPSVSSSLFDTNGTIPVEVTISDKSIFVPGGGAPQVGFRRSELLPGTNNGTDATTKGITTFHWSVRSDPARPLNFSHEYHPAWHETNDYSSSQFTFLTGKPFSDSFDPGVSDPQTLRLAGRHGANSETTFFSTKFTPDVWHNFGLTVGWDSNQLTFYYSNGTSPLKKVAGPSSNDNSGGGQFHFGTFKLPTGPSNIDVLHEGYQQPNLNEGLIFGGIFIEDSSNGCVTTASAAGGRIEWGSQHGHHH